MIRLSIVLALTGLTPPPAQGGPRVLECVQTDWRGPAPATMLNTRFRINGNMWEEWSTDAGEWTDYCNQDGVATCRVDAGRLERWVRDETVIIRTVVDLSSGDAVWDLTVQNDGRARTALGRCQIERG